MAGKWALGLIITVFKILCSPLLYLTVGLKENVEKDILGMLQARSGGSTRTDGAQSEADTDQDRYVQDKLVSTWQNFALLVSPSAHR